MCKYKLGLIVGRFQSFHLGHEEVVKRALSVCDKVLILIGSAQEANTNKNPFSYEFRYKMLSTVFEKDIHSGKISIQPLNDIGVGNNSNWGTYVLDSVYKYENQYPDILISGKEERRISWFDSETTQIAELYIPKILQISATQLRNAILDDNFEFWSKYINPKLHCFYHDMKEIFDKSNKNIETSSL